MQWQVLQSVWPVLVFLCGAMGLGVLHTLATQRRNNVEVHDRIRKSEEVRKRYLDALKDKQKSY